MALHHQLSSSPNKDREDEGVRSMVAECLGRLAYIDAQKIFPVMERLVVSEKPFVRGLSLSPLSLHTHTHHTFGICAYDLPKGCSRLFMHLLCLFFWQVLWSLHSDTQYLKVAPPWFSRRKSLRSWPCSKMQIWYVVTWMWCTQTHFSCKIHPVYPFPRTQFDRRFADKQSWLWVLLWMWMPICSLPSSSKTLFSRCCTR